MANLIGTLASPAGGPATGKLTLTPPSGVSLVGFGGGQQGVPQNIVTINVIDGVLQSPPPVLGNDKMLPPSTAYYARLVESNGRTSYGQWEITGTSYDVSTSVPAVATPGIVDSVVAGPGISIDNTNPMHPVISATGGGGGGIDSIVAGSGISIDNTDPLNPIISATGGGGGIGGTIASGQIAFGTGVDTIGGSADFTRDLTTGEVDITGHGDISLLYLQPIATADGQFPFGLEIQVRAGGFAVNQLTGILIAPSALNGGSAVDGYGLFVDDQTHATNNWAIRTKLGRVVLGDNGADQPGQILFPNAVGAVSGGTDFTRDLTSGQISIAAGAGTTNGVDGLFVQSTLFSGDSNYRYGLEAFVENAGAGTLYQAVGLWVDNAANSGGGTIASLFGVYVDDQVVGTNNWAIRTNLGLVQFGDESILDPVLQGYTSPYGLLVNGLTGDLGVLAGFEAQDSGFGTLTVYAVGTSNGSGRRGVGIEGDGLALADGASAYGVTAFVQGGKFAVTNLADFHAYSPSVQGTATNVYGLLIDDINAGTNRWAIKTGLGLTALGGNPLTMFDGLYVGPDESTLPALIQNYTDGALLVTGQQNGTGIGVEFTAANGQAVYAVALGNFVESFYADAYGSVDNSHPVAFYAGYLSANGFAASSITGLQVQTFHTDGGSIENAYGIFLEDQNVATSNFSIKTGLGLAAFGGVPLTMFDGLYVGPDESTLPSLLQGYAVPAQVLITSTLGGAGLGVESVSGVGIYAVTVTAQSQNAGIESDIYAGGDVDFKAFDSYADANGFSVGNIKLYHAVNPGLSGGTIGSVYGFIVDSLSSGTDFACAFYTGDVTGATNNYAFKSGAGMVEIGDAFKSAGVTVRGNGTAPGLNSGTMTQMWLDATAVPSYQLVFSNRSYADPTSTDNFTGIGLGDDGIFRISPDNGDSASLTYNPTGTNWILIPTLQVGAPSATAGIHVQGAGAFSIPGVGNALLWLDADDSNPYALALTNVVAGPDHYTNFVVLNDGSLNINVDGGGTNAYLNYNVSSTQWAIQAASLQVSSWISTLRNTAPADGDIAANEMAMWFDPTNGSAKGMFKAKQSDGTVVTGVLGTNGNSASVILASDGAGGFESYPQFNIDPALGGVTLSSQISNGGTAFNLQATAIATGSFIYGESINVADAGFANTNVAGLNIGPSNVSASTNLYGLFVDDQVGAVNNWAIKTGLGLVEFGDDIKLGGAQSNRVNFVAGNGGSAPSPSTIVLPTSVYGGSAQLLGGPAGWIDIQVNGVARKIPVY